MVSVGLFHSSSLDPNISTVLSVIQILDHTCIRFVDKAKLKALVNLDDNQLLNVIPLSPKQGLKLRLYFKK